MTQEQETEEDGRNRREHERVRVSQPVKMEATLRGRFIDIMRLEMTGVTIDMSDGGFRANVDQSISPGVRCRIELPGEDGAEPKNLWGRVRRTTSGNKGFVVALEFDEPQAAAEALGGADPEGAEGTVIEVAEVGDEDDGAEAPAAPKKKTRRKAKTKKK